jgi:NAD-dependent dihydropyrimidine dehydrogenase PreA subunit
MAIKKVWMEEDCTACKLCVDTCPVEVIKYEEE